MLWLVRPSDQPGDFMRNVKYVTISLLLVAVTTIQARLRELNICGAGGTFMRVEERAISAAKSAGMLGFTRVSR